MSDSEFYGRMSALFGSLQHLAGLLEDPQICGVSWLPEAIDRQICWIQKLINEANNDR